MNTRPPEAPRATPNDAAVDRARARIMAMSLRVLLDRVTGARDALPHLAALESALQQQGLLSLDAMSLPVLSRVSSQLASLPVSESDAPLQDLQSRLLVALAARTQAPPVAAAVPTVSRTLSPEVESFDGALVVSEISHSAFLEAIGEPEATVPMTLAAGPAS